MSVVFLSYNRGDLLADGLRSVLAQEGVRAEVLVVDNGSSDGTPERIEREFPAVRLIRNPRNHPLAGRNLGLREASHALVLSMDDDVELLDPHSLARVARHLRDTPGVGALTLKICDPESAGEYAPEHWWHPRPRLSHQDREFTTDHFNEAAVAFRAEALAAAGYYFEDLFWGGEEWDLALGLMDAGWELRYFPEPVLHKAPRGNLALRADPRQALLLRNRCWIALRRLDPLSMLAYTLPRLALWAARSIRYGYFPDYLRGLADLLRRGPTLWRERRPISRDTRRRLRQIRAAPAAQ